MWKILLAGACLALLLAGCSTVRKTQPPRTATQELLLSTAADHAANKLHPAVPAGSKIYINTSDFKGGYGTKYAISRITSQLLSEEYDVVGKETKADYVAQIRSGSLSINKSSQLWIGVPSVTLPIPFAGPVKTPELPFFKTEKQKGIAKFAVTLYNAKTGKLAANTGSVYGFSHRNHYVVMLVGWTKSDLLPKNSPGLH